MVPPRRIIAPVTSAFAAELRAARQRAGLTRAELARRANMTRYGLIKLERRGNPMLGTIALLANALGCEVADFFPRRATWRQGCT